MMTFLAIWILIAALSGFVIAAVFSGWMKLQRNLFLLFYVPFVYFLTICFFHSNNLRVFELITYKWYWGIAGIILSGAFVIKNVLSQPSSERSKGPALISDILWPGFAYGLADSLLLSVVPVISVKLMFHQCNMTDGFLNNLLYGVSALAASLIATAVYHLGYVEFRGKKVIWPMVGNGILSLALILTGNILAALIPHIAMHIAAMLHGPKTTGQVPPHYVD